MIRRLTLMCLLCFASSSFAADQPEVRVEPSHLQGPRLLDKQTADAAVRDYLQAWESLEKGFAENRVDALDSAFVGDAREKLGSAISEQSQLGLRTNYRDRAHDIQIIFYSPDGLSIQLTDKVDYDVQILDREKPKSTQQVSAKYIAVLTPSEVRWRVRILQGQSQ
jgi:hypothetical protein